MRKADMITELYRRTLKELTSSKRAWMDFLKTAAFQYKYPFSDQVLIYAQRPGAVACAELEVWNERFGRWVNQGAHGIALIRDKGGRVALTHVFDVKDTHHREETPFRLWEARPEMRREIAEALENHFGHLPMKATIGDAAICACDNICEDNYRDYLENLMSTAEGSLLDDYDEDNMRVRLLPLLKYSTAYSVLARLGYKADESLDIDDLNALREFNTPEVINLLGTATSDISEICLREIERTVRAYEKNKIRTFAENENVRYNDTEKTKSLTQGEQGNEHGSYDELQSTGRRGDPRPASPRADELSARQVRNDASRISQEAPQRNLYDTADHGEAERTSARGGGSGEGTDLGEYIPDGTEPWSDRADESREPDAVGTDDELDQGISGGGSIDQPDLSVDQSIDQSNAAISDSTLPNITDMQTLIEILRHGDYLRKSKEEIVSFLRSGATEEQTIQFVREAYPPLQFSEFFKLGTQQHLGYRADDHGLMIYEGNFPSRTAESEMSWSLVTDLIGALIKDQNYLDAPITQKQTEKKQEPFTEERNFAESKIPVSEYDLQLGTTVYIGKNECEILLMGKDKVELFDGTLFPLEMEHDTFIRRIRENPLNDHLRKDFTGQTIETPDPKTKAKSTHKQNRKRKSDEPTIEFVTSDLESDYARWDELFTNGGSDPTWSDGVNMNLVQGRIVANRRHLLEMCGDGERPAILNREEPPRVSNDYMARADEIREAAKKSLDIYQSDPTYQWCIEQVKRISDKMLKNSLIPNLLSYVTALEGYIENDDLVGMRRHRDPNRYMDNSERCKREIEKLLPQIEQNQQIDDIFNMLMDNAMVADEQPRYPKDVHIYIDADREEVIWIYYNSDAASGGQFVTNSLDFNVFKEAYDDFSTSDGNWNDKTARDKFIDSISDMADCYIADISTPFFVESQADYEEKPDYVEFTSDNIQRIGQDIENYIVNLEAEQAINSHEAEFGADGTRVFRASETDESITLEIKEHLEKYVPIVSEAISQDTAYCNACGNSDYENAVMEGNAAIRRVVLNMKDMELLKLFLDHIDFRHELYPRVIVNTYEKLHEMYRPMNQDDVDRLAEQTREEPFVPGIEKITLFEQYDRLKKSYPDAIAAIRVGDFYEFFDEDAEKMAKALELVMTSRAFPDGTRHPMCGFPFHKGQEYFDRLNKQGFFVALCDGDGDPAILLEPEKQLDEELDELPVMPTMQEPQKNKPQVAGQVFHPEVAADARIDHKIHAEDLPLRTPSDKYARNIRAIRLLHQLEEENRLATPSEQKILADYSGWGGLADRFDESHSDYEELKSVLTPEEYTAARESTLTAFYTPPVVIEAVYKALANMGFKRGNILEPSCGVGNFIGFIPESMSDSKVYGVELDSLSGRMAQQLYQKQNITVGGFEETVFPDSFFDVAIGNVPFGQFKVVDRKYDKYNFLIHDFFFAKALDKVRPGGVVAFITSKGTLDKENSAVRKYIAGRAELLGAIRLPDNAFKSAGTEVVSDIIFLQKRDRVIEAEPDWVHLGKDENGIAMNQYFVDNPDMILGETVIRSGPFGPESTCRAYEGQDLGELLDDAISNIHAEITEVDGADFEEDINSIPADPTVKNFSYTLVDGKVYYRQNSMMNRVETTVTGENRIKGMIAIRDTVRALIDAQLEDEPDSVITVLQAKLNMQYDSFVGKYGLINSRGNESVFSDDSSYFLLSSLEILNEDKELERKADMFTKRTIKPYVKIDRVDTASEALAVSLSERACVDMKYMSGLTGKSEKEIYEELKGVIFLNPLESDVMNQPKYLTADEYLSGNVREKLARVRGMVEAGFSEYAVNVEALEKIQPKDLTAPEIGIKLGSTWVPDDIVQDFVFGLLGTPSWAKWNMSIKYIPQTAQWVITNKSYDKTNVKANTVYGTNRVNAYEIIEDTLNLKDVRVFDYIEDGNVNKKAVLNKRETTIAQGKQEEIKRAFEDWVWQDPERREELCKLYNEKFNSIRPREYDGSHIRYYGMNPEIKLRKHQTDAVARIMYGGNTLLAHVVGAGKTFTMVAAAQEMKRLGLCHKSMFVVPNHLIEQWASEYLQLYPSANILVATKKDFETKNRKKFCARIATGDYDAVIIGHSQFEKIPVSIERQQRTLEAEIEELTNSIAELKYQRGERVTVKQLEKSKKQLETRLKKLNDQSRKDDVVNFEELGIDRIFVDEAHFYKNRAKRCA